MQSGEWARQHIVASAALGALSEARSRGADLVARRSREAACEQLRGLAAEMASSPIGRDQVLRLALMAAAENLERGEPVEAAGAQAFLGRPPAVERERLEIRRRVFQAGGTPAAESARVADSLERRHRPECANASELSERLMEDATLHEILWDEPRLACDDRTRLVMLLSVPKLLERAEQLDPAAVRSPRPPLAGPGARDWLKRRLFGPRPAVWLLAPGLALLAASGAALAEA